MKIVCNKQLLTRRLFLDEARFKRCDGFGISLPDKHCVVLCMWLSFYLFQEPDRDM